MNVTSRNSKIGFVNFQKKKKWKQYKLHSAKLYLLYFKTENPQKPDGEILLSSITKLETEATKDATYPFQVHFKGKAQNGAGSPWAFDLDSNEERIEWMEAIKPGSSEYLQRFSNSGSLRRTVSPQSYSQYGAYSKGGPDPSVSNGARPEAVDVGSSLHTVGHQSSPVQPLNYMEPVCSIKQGNPHTQTERSQSEHTFGACAAAPPSSLSQSADSRLREQVHREQVHREQVHSHRKGQAEPVHVNPRQASHRSTFAHLERESKTAPLSRSHTEKAPRKVDEDHLYELDGMDVLKSIKPPLPDRAPPKAKPRKQPPLNLSASLPESQTVASPSGDNYVSPDEMEPRYAKRPGNQTDSVSRPGPRLKPISPLSSQVPGDTPSKPPITPRRKASQPKPSERPQQEPAYLSLLDGGENAARSGPAVQGFGEAMKHFPPLPPEQLQSLISMLQQVQTNGNHHPAAKPAAQTSEQGANGRAMSDHSQIEKSFERAVSYTPQLQTDKILVTEEDDSDGYEARPDWAKAVGLRKSNTNQDSHDPDTLSDLQEEALHIPRSRLADFTVIGEGQFGKVFRAVMQRGSEPISVAVKTAKKSTSPKEQEEFLREMNIMSLMVHPNIVQLYGIVRDDVPAPWIVLEYLHNGDIKHFLMKHERSIEKLVKYMIDVSMGMHYLSERGLIHRDLAARNVLVGKNETCKVSDFGLLRELPKDDSIYHMKTSVPCPIRWMPPESIADRIFSPASDVWSFGILLWEMFLPHKTPYEELGNIEVAMKVMKGHRLEIPAACPHVIRRIMKACWHAIPDKRPSFLLISTLLTTKVIFSHEAN